MTLLHVHSALAVHTQRIQPGVEVNDRCRVRNAIAEYRWKDGEGADLGYWYVIHFVPSLREGFLDGENDLGCGGCGGGRSAVNSHSGVFSLFP